jgi:hypothetical protein
VTRESADSISVTSRSRPTSTAHPSASLPRRSRSPARLGHDPELSAGSTPRAAPARQTAPRACRDYDRYRAPVCRVASRVAMAATRRRFRHPLVAGFAANGALEVLACRLRWGEPPMHPTNFHDRLFRGVFSQPEHAAGERRSLLPADVAHRIDWSTESHQGARANCADLPGAGANEQRLAERAPPLDRCARGAGRRSERNRCALDGGARAPRSMSGDTAQALAHRITSGNT